MVPRTLDLDSVQAFVLAADLGSFTRAADALAVSQAAISLRLKRLEDRLGHRLLERTPRHVRLSRRGEAFLPAARTLLDAHEQALAGIEEAPRSRLVLGISDHVAGPELPIILKRLNAEKSTLVIEVRVAPSRELTTLFDGGGFDAVITRAEASTVQDGVILREERLAWFAASDFAREPDEPLRVAALATSWPCGVRSAATRVLDAAGIAWSEVFLGTGVLAIGAAVEAGLAVAALAPSTAPPSLVDVGYSLGLPELPLSAVLLRARPLQGQASAALRALAASYRRTTR